MQRRYDGHREMLDMDMVNIVAVLDRVGIVNMVGMMKMVVKVQQGWTIHIYKTKIYHKSHLSEFSLSS